MKLGKPPKEWAQVWNHDADVDPPAGLYVAAHTYWTNPHSATMALLSVSGRDVDPVAYDAVALWLMTLEEGLSAERLEREWETDVQPRSAAELTTWALEALKGIV